MAKGNKKARAVQRVIGCRYMAALRFVKSPIWAKEAESYAREHGVSKRSICGDSTSLLHRSPCISLTRSSNCSW